MRSLLVVSNPNLPDIVFFSADDEFCSEINQKAKQSGWSPEENVSPHVKVDLHILLQYLQSLIASHQAMSSMLGCPYQSLTTENGSLVVIREHKDFLYIAINGDQSETKQYMLHRIFILQRVVEFFFGLNPEKLGCNNDKGRQEQLWGQIIKILNTWEYLYHIEQSFLMEAVERLNVNHFLNGICIKLLEETLMSSGDKSRAHALLLVKGKLLALFSSPNAPELLSSSTLMIAIIAESFYPSPRTFSEESDQFLSGVDAGLTGRKVGGSQFYVGEDYATAAEDNKSDNSSASYYSPHQGPSPLQSDHEEETKNTQEGTGPIETPSRETHPLDVPESGDTYSTPNRGPIIEEATNESGEREGHISGDGDSEMYPGGFQLFVFLQHGQKKHIPHKLTLIPILPGITMIVVSERRSSFGEHIVDALDLLQRAYNKRQEVLLRGPKHPLISKLDDLVDREIVGYLKTLKADTKRAENQVVDSLKKFKSVLNRTSSEESFIGEIDSLCLQLKDLFRNVFSQHREIIQQIPPEMVGAHGRCRISAREKLEFYEEYLLVRGEKNLTMMPYLEKFPGLVHFIHIDRRENQITAPSVNINYRPGDETGKGDAHRTLVWNFIEKSRQFFQSDTTTVHFEVGDFQISSFLYFEDGLSNILPPSNSPKTSREGLYPGLQAELHFWYLKDQHHPGSSDDIKCCELHCIHLAIVPLNVVAQQVRKLRERLCEARLALTTNLL